MNPNECQHDETYDDDDGDIWCNDCGVWLGAYEGYEDEPDYAWDNEDYPSQY